MSITALAARLFRHGQIGVRTLCTRQNPTIAAEKINAIQVNAVKSTRGDASRSLILRAVGQQVSSHARRIFIDGFLNRITNSLVSELRKKATRRILYGDSGAFFAFVGISLASDTGLITKDDEFEGVCWEIRHAISKIKWNFKYSTPEEQEPEYVPSKADDFNFGNPIAKGANAVVYAAHLKSEQSTSQVRNDDCLNYPLAVKMMFNYDVQSNAMAILNAMYSETVPARTFGSDVTLADLNVEDRVNLPPHPNVVEMYNVFADAIPELSAAKQLYPAALPARIYSDGDGRNMSLFLVMKRYNSTLREFMNSNEVSTRTSTLLFAQLLEAIAHLSLNGIAHRDLKSDNLLLDTIDECVPLMVLSDFGCCLADKRAGLMLSYTSREVNKGGNTALMAPEILTQKPGTFSVLNYSKSDLWAAGAIAYEIYGMINPFYDGNNWQKLQSSDYDPARLPDLPSDVPSIIHTLVKNILKRYPNERVTPEMAATVMQLHLWAPRVWFSSKSKPSNTEIMQWLIGLTLKVICDRRMQMDPVNVSTYAEKAGRRTFPEYLLIGSFLRRVTLSDIRKSLFWMRDNI